MAGAWSTARSSWTDNGAIILVPTLEAALHAPGAREVCIDVTRLTFCDARGLLGAASLTRAARSAGTSVDVVGLAPHLARLLWIVGAELA